MATARYIRLFANASTSNSGTHLVEVEAYTSDSTNVALGKSVTSSPSITNGSLAAMTDGVTASSAWNGLDSTAGMTNVVDLGQEYDIVEVRVYRYGLDSRSYYQDTVEISTDGTTYTTVGGPQTQQYAGDGAYWSVTIAAQTSSSGGPVGSYSGTAASGSLSGTVSLSDPGEYTLNVTTEFEGEVRIWGAAGGGLNGGQGGFTSGTYTFTPGSYIVWVGGGGKVNTNSSAGAEGGFGGGGFCGTTNNSGAYSSSGGGLSGIFAGSVSQANAIAIAGGGGGAGSFNIGNNGAAGGAGGGASGTGGGAAGNGGGGGGGTQSAGGGAGSAISSYSVGSTAGSALAGGNGRNVITGTYTGAGGGGGYFGGGGGGGNNYTGGGGGGGSGFAGSGFTTAAFADTDQYYVDPAGKPGPATAAQMASGDGLVVIVAPGSTLGEPNDDSYQIYGLTPAYAFDFGGVEVGSALSSPRLVTVDMAASKWGSGYVNSANGVTASYNSSNYTWSLNGDGSTFSGIIPTVNFLTVGDIAQDGGIWMKVRFTSMDGSLGNRKMGGWLFSTVDSGDTWTTSHSISVLRGDGNGVMYSSQDETNAYAWDYAGVNPGPMSSWYSALYFNIDTGEARHYYSTDDITYTLWNSKTFGANHGITGIYNFIWRRTVGTTAAGTLVDATDVAGLL